MLVTAVVEGAPCFLAHPLGMSCWTDGCTGLLVLHLPDGSRSRSSLDRQVCGRVLGVPAAKLEPAPGAVLVVLQAPSVKHLPS